tara:strand:+ start:120 stop:2057 length:1938 start_codon:yes stop_codon:yes gene_type:complete
VALKKPDELFEKKKDVVKNTPLTFNENVNNIRNQFNKVDELKKELESVSVSLNDSLTQVVDNNVNLISFKTEYDDLLNGLNDKIENIKEEFSNEVKEIKKYQSNLSAEVTIIEQRQKKTKLVDHGLKEEIIIDVKNLLSGNVLNNIKHLEEKVDSINEKHIKSIKSLNESYSEPPNVKNSDPLTPLDQKFVNLDDFQNHYRLFLNRIQRQLSTLGGGGAVLVSDLDDVETSTARVNGKYLRYNSTKGKWEGADASGGGGGGGLSNIVEDTTPQLGGSLDVNSKEIISVSNNNITFAPNGTGKVVFKGVSGNGGNGAGRFVLNCEQNSHGITIQGPPHSAGANYTLTLPNTDGNADQVLKTNGSGVLDWVDQTSGSSQNLFSTIAVSGQNNVVADSTTDTLTLVAGSNMTITTNASGDSITFEAAGGSSLSTEQVQDIVGAMFTGNTETNITATYQDSDGTIDLVASGGSSLSTEQVQDIVGAMFTGNTETNITATYQDSDGTIDLVASGGGGTSLGSRTTTNASTGSISRNSSANITIPTAGKSFSLLKIEISAPAYVVLYVDSASRSSDSSRSEGTDPLPGSGVLTEISTTSSGSSTFLMSPAVLGWNNDGTPAAQVYAKVKNKRATSGSNAITVTLTTVALEA